MESNRLYDASLLTLDPCYSRRIKPALNYFAQIHSMLCITDVQQLFKYSGTTENSYHEFLNEHL
jgi:hypothetical protein